MSIWQVASNVADIKKNHGPRYRSPRAYEPNSKTKHKTPKWKQWLHWPTPFGSIEHLEANLCGQEAIVELEMFGMMAANFFIANFLPDPKELTRNWLTGKWRCGLRFDYNLGEVAIDDIKAASPLDIIWSDGNAARVVAGSLLPVLETFYVMWAAGTAFAALSMFNTVLIELAACDSDPYAVNLALGDISLNVANGTGAFNGYNIISDPHNLSNKLDGFVLLTEGAADFMAFGHVTSFGKIVDSCKIYWNGLDDSYGFVQLGGILPGETKAWKLRGSLNPTAGQVVQVAMDIVQHGASIAATFGDCVRLTVNQHAVEKTHTAAPRYHDRRCWAANAPPMDATPTPVG